MFTSDGELPTAYDDPQIMKWVEAAYNLQPTEEVGPMPEFEPSAWLELADYLDQLRDPRADDVRALGKARFSLPPAGLSRAPQVIASGGWWDITLRQDYQGFHIAWAVHSGTNQ